MILLLPQDKLSKSYQRSLLYFTNTYMRKLQMEAELHIALYLQIFGNHSLNLKKI
jgi:hypothetical protein